MKDWLAAARANPLFPLVLIIGGLTIALDQAAKLWIVHGLKLQDRPFGHLDISPIFDLTYVENRGVSFGLFAGGITSRVLLTVLALGVAAFVIRWAGRLDRRFAAIGAGLIVGGAIGNAIDRTFYGYVVDFLDFASIGFPWRFNVADAAINLGVASLAYDAFFIAPKSEGTAARSGGSETSSFAKGEDSNETEGTLPFPEEDGVSITPKEQRSGSSE